jgi:hypothetical protein
MKHQEQIIETIIKDIRLNKEDWYGKFNELDILERTRILKDLITNYYTSIINFTNELDPSIHIQCIGTLIIKPSRKQYLDLKKEGIDGVEAAKIVKEDYRKTNGKA